MIDRRTALTALGAIVLVPSFARAATVNDKLVLTDAQWKARLTPEQFDILRREGTEVPFSSKLDFEKRPGTYFCAGCNLALFSSKTKYDSGTGWPSFWAPLPHAVSTKSDTSLPGEERNEVHCRRCGGHLGHVFDDGPPPTGKRYCMDGVALKFKPAA
jgi:peptide-methionine (R)-S-oxide reductase